MIGRISSVAAALTLASVSIGTGLTLDAAPARATTSLLAWTSQADANTFDLVVDNASGLDGAHPLAEIDVPEDSSNFETGPLGYALASIVWPGAIVGNLGSVAGEAGLPSQLASAAGELNDPVKAESFYPAGPTSATFPSGAPSSGLIEMSSDADANQSSAKAGLSDVSIPGVFDLQGVQGNTTATATSGAQSAASGSFSALSLLGGMIQIGATTSTASASSDGSTPSGSATTNLGAITIAGQPVSVGSSGLVVGPAAANLGGLLGIPTTLINELVSVLNLKMTLLPETQSSQGRTETITSEGLSVSFALPSNLSLALDCSSLPSELAQLNLLCHLPDELTGLNFTFNLARVTASAFATQPFSTDLSTGAAQGPAAGSPQSAFTAGGVSTSPEVPTQPVSTTTTPRAASSPLRRITGILSVALSSPVGAGLLIFLIALAAAFGLGMRRLAAGMARPRPDEDCSLEEGP